MKKIKLLLLNVYSIGSKLEPIECGDLQDYYDAIHCDTIDIARRKIGGKYFDIFVDDVGLFKPNPTISAVDKNNNPMLVGNLVFALHDNEGNTVGLSDENMDIIRDNLIWVARSDSLDDVSKAWQAVVCEY